MARIRATVSGEQNAAFRAAPNSGSWILDGLEITDNAGRQTVNALVDLGISATGVHDIVVQTLLLSPERNRNELQSFSDASCLV
jgi:hypothetical protein